MIQATTFVDTSTWIDRGLHIKSFSIKEVASVADNIRVCSVLKVTRLLEYSINFKELFDISYKIFGVLFHSPQEGLYNYPYTAADTNSSSFLGRPLPSSSEGSTCTCESNWWCECRRGCICRNFDSPPPLSSTAVDRAPVLEAPAPETWWACWNSDSSSRSRSRTNREYDRHILRPREACRPSGDGFASDPASPRKVPRYWKKSVTRNREILSGLLAFEFC